MKRPTVLGGIAVAAVLSLGSIPLRAVLHLILSPDVAVRVCILALAVAYGLWTLSGRVRRVGTVTLGVFMFVLFSSALIFRWEFMSVLWLAIGVTWFVRCIARYRSISIAFLDGAFAIGAVLCAATALGATGNPTLAIWCYFLIVALTALLPAQLPSTNWSRPDGQSTGQSPFEQAFASADAALREIIRRQATQ